MTIFAESHNVSPILLMPSAFCPKCIAGFIFPYGITIPPLSFCCPEIGCFGQWLEPCFSPSVVRQQALFLPHQSTTTHVFAEVFPFTFRRPFSLNKAISRRLSPTIAKYLCSLCRLSCAASCALISAAGFVPGNEIQAPIVLLADRR